MFYISKVHIIRFRSIMDMCFNIQNSDLTIAICGQNNVGKTNTLRAIDLFFHPDAFDQKKDIPVVKAATRGGSYYPKITLTFSSFDDPNTTIEICRDFKSIDKKNAGLSGNKYVKKGKKKLKVSFSESELLSFINAIEFRFIRSIDVNTSELISVLTNDLLDMEYLYSRFANNKKSLKIAYDEYSEGMQKILDKFSEDVSEVFHSFKDNWDVKFIVPSQIDRFRDMISDNVELKIDDKSGLGVNNKGSGLQRLAIILLNIEVLKRMDKAKKKSFIICIDEPDIYLHEGMQKKLYEFIKESKFQVFYTTHSKNFIDENNLNSILFLEAELTSQYYERVKKEVDYITTTCTSVNDKDGYYKICDHLGIEPISISEPVLSKYNVLVEGECDVNYLTKLVDYYGITRSDVKLISADGASLIPPMLSVYDTLSLAESDSKPIIHVVFDNDEAGQKEYKIVCEKVKNGRYRRIVVQPFLIHNFKGESPTHANHEIEDLLYPEVFCHVVNVYLTSLKMTPVDTSEVIEYYDTPRFKTKGILHICDFLMSYANVDKTLSISDKRVKGDLCELFDTSNPDIKKLLDKARAENSFVESFVKKMFDFD